jgi:hypothetical protein
MFVLMVNVWKEIFQQSDSKGIDQEISFTIYNRSQNWAWIAAPVFG